MVVERYAIEPRAPALPSNHTQRSIWPTTTCAFVATNRSPASDVRHTLSRQTAGRGAWYSCTRNRRDLQTATNNFTDKPRGSAGVAIRKKAQAIEKASEAINYSPAAEPSPDLPAPRLNVCNACGERIEGTDGFAKARHNKTCSAKSSSEEASPIEDREE